MYLVLTHLSNSETRILKELGYKRVGKRPFLTGGDKFVGLLFVKRIHESLV